MNGMYVTKASSDNILFVSKGETVEVYCSAKGANVWFNVTIPEILRVFNFKKEDDWRSLVLPYELVGSCLYV